MLIYFTFLETQVGGTVGCVLNLEGKLEFPSYLALILIPHWIGDGRLGGIPTPLMPIIMSVGPWATSPHACTHAETGPARAGFEFGFGWRAPTTCGHEYSSIQRSL